MKEVILAGLLSGAAFLASQNVQAAPTLYPDYFNSNIRNSTNSNYLADSEDRNRFYVLPPNNSFAQIKGLHTITANVGFCGEIAKLQKYNSDTLDLLNSMKIKDLATRAQYEEQNTELKLANEELSRFVITSDLQELASLDVRVMQLEKRLDDLYVKYKRCDRDCAVLQKDIDDSQLIRTELSVKRFELSAGNLMASNEYERKKVNVQNLKNNVEVLQSNWRQIQADLKDLYTEFNKMFDAHAQREGGRVAINYESRWNENLDLLRSQNPNYRFEKIQTKNANIKASAYSKPNLLPGGSILAFDVGGQSANMQNNLQNRPGILNLESFPESFSGNAVLNLLAICPLLHPDWFDISMPNSPENMTYGVTVGYEYPSVMKYAVTAHYNMYRMYELIKSQGTSGGFFSSSSWSAHDEQEFFKDSFSVDWKIQDDKQLLTYEQKAAINSDLRHQVMTRMANQLVMNDQTAKTNLAFEVPKTGAQVLSNSLDKSCPVNLYCRGASIVINVLQAIFGSTETQQNFKQVTNVDMTDSYSNSQIVMQPMLTTFK